MKALTDIYKKSFFGRRYKYSWRSPIVCNALELLFKALEIRTKARIVDVGCGIGDYVAELRNRGYKAHGIEGSAAVKPFLQSAFVHIRDLRLLIKDMAVFDFCMCLEVAEHIEEEYVDIFIENLINLSDLILITAACPGQGGHYHVNLQEKKYWEEKFWARNYVRCLEYEEIWKSGIEQYKCKPEIKSYYVNSMFFCKGGWHG